MTAKTRVLYDGVFEFLKTLVPDLKTERFVSDFEVGLQRSLNHVFPDSVIQGCYFHYSQAIWRKANKIGVISAVRANKHVENWIKQVMALALLPSDDIMTFYQTNLHPSNLPDNYSQDSNIQSLYQYVEEY